ncbi:MAG: hypothetical protein AB7K71_18250 [Polyangiaceae bacterium]
MRSKLLFPLSLLLLVSCADRQREGPKVDAPEQASSAESKKISVVVPVTVDNIREGMVVFRNPKWDGAWGAKDIHPNQGVRGRIRSWSDQAGKPHGNSKGDLEQLKWEAIACVDWDAGEEEWKSRQGYRIGFLNEYWLATSDTAP